MAKRRWIVPQPGAEQGATPAAHEDGHASPPQERPEPPVVPPAPEPSVAVAPEAPAQPTQQWATPASPKAEQTGPSDTGSMGPGRWILLVLLLLAGAASSVILSEPLNPTETATAVIAGVIAVAFWWLLGGALVWLVRLAVRRRRRFGVVMLSPAVLGTMLAVFCVSALGTLSINAREAADRIAAPSAAAADVEDELSAEQEAMVDYINGFVRCAEDASEGRVLERRFLKALERGDWTSSGRHARRARANLADMHRCLGGLTGTGDAELEPLAQDNADALGVMVSAYTSYVNATKTQNIDGFDAGDVKARRAQRQSRRTARRIDALYRTRDYKRLARYIDFERLVRARERAGL